MGVRNSGSSSQVSQGSRPLDDLLWHTAVFILMPCKYVSLLILHLYSCPHASVFTHSFCTLTCISTLGGVICKEKNLYPQPGFFNLSTGYLLPSWVGAERSCPTCYGMFWSLWLCDTQMEKSEVKSVSCSLVSSSLQLHRL